MSIKKHTLQMSFHIAILVLLGVGTLTAYYWFFPLGIILEIGFWLWLTDLA